MSLKQRRREPLLELGEGDTRHLVVLKQIDDEPLGRRALGKQHTPKEEASSVEGEIARTPGVIDKRRSEHRGRPEAQRIPPWRPGDHEAVLIEERAQDFLVSRRCRTETALEGRIEEPVASLAQPALTNETTSQPSGIGAPNAEAPWCSRPFRARPFRARDRALPQGSWPHPSESTVEYILSRRRFGLFVAKFNS